MINRTILLFIGTCLMSMIACNRTSSSQIEEEYSKAFDKHKEVSIAPITSIAHSVSYLCLGHQDGWVSSWKNEQKVWRLQTSWMAHQSTVRDIQCQNDWISYSVGADGTWVIWDQQSQMKKRHRMSNVFHLNQVKHDKEISYIATDRGSIVALKNNKEVWRTGNIHGRATFGVQLYRRSDHSDDQRLLSIGSDGYVRLWKKTDGTHLAAWKAHIGWGVFLEPLKSMWLTAGADGKLCLWPTIDESKINQEKQELEIKAIDCLQAHKDEVTRVFIHTLKDQTWIISADTGGQVLLTQLVIQDQAIHLQLRRTLQLKQAISVLSLSATQNTVYVSAPIGDSLLWYTTLPPSYHTDNAKQWVDAIPSLKAVVLD